MKRSTKSIMLTAALVIGMFTLGGCSKKESNDVKEGTKTEVIKTADLKKNLGQKSWVVVDTRINDSYNGWTLNGEERGGHIKDAVDFSANWLDVKKDDKDKVLAEALKTKGIDKDKNIVLYDSNGKDAKKVATYLADKGYTNLYTYDVKEWAKDSSLPMDKYEDYKMIVPAKVVKDLVDGKKPESFENAKNVKIVEASWGKESESYSKGHIPTSVHIDTDTVEPPPAWMMATDKELTKFAKDYGFTKDDTIVVTGAEPMASYRVAVILRYMGVSDVRVLNGGTNAWTSAGYELETKSNAKKSGDDFGATIPQKGDLVDTIPELKQKLKESNYTLVDNRSWDEYIGKDSGYSYHKEKGRIPGAVYGYAGTEGSTSLNYYRNIDNTMRNAYEIKAMWKDAKIDVNNHLAFMCGSGWRAAEVLTYANVMGLKNTSLYSDGWIGWSNDKTNPTETGEPK